MIRIETKNTPQEINIHNQNINADISIGGTVMILDFETNGVNAQECEVIECAFMIAQFDENGFNELQSRSFLVKPNAPITQEITNLTTITNEMLKSRLAITKDRLSAILLNAIKEVNYVIAHNGVKFDFVILKRLIGTQNLQHVKLLDTYLHEDYKKKLCLVAMDNGIMPLQQHRAMSDVQTLFAILKKRDKESRPRGKNIVFAIQELSQDYYVASCNTPTSWNKEDIKSKLRGMGFFWDFERRVYVATVRAGDIDKIKSFGNENGIKFDFLMVV